MTQGSRSLVAFVSQLPDRDEREAVRGDLAEAGETAGQGFGGGEAPNALVPPAIAAAFFDATGVHPRKLQLTLQYVTAFLGG